MNMNERMMMKTNKWIWPLRWGLVGVLAGWLVFPAVADQEQLARSIAEARAETARTTEQLQATLLALNKLTKQEKGDLRPAFEAFEAAVSRTQSDAATTEARVTWMAGDGQKYFEAWQKSIDSISNVSLKRKAEKRLKAVQESYDKAEASLRKAGDKFKQLLSNLADVQKALAGDVTAGGMKAIRSTVDSANWDHRFVDQAMASALKELNRMEKALSSEAK